jgi:hypothetical protein
MERNHPAVTAEYFICEPFRSRVAWEYIYLVLVATIRTQFGENKMMI